MASTVPDQLLHWSKADPRKPAFIFCSDHPQHKRTVLTREELFGLASRYAAILRRKGVKKGHVVCNTLPNSPERLVTDLGILLAGGVAMNGAVFLADGADFVDTIKRSQCTAIITDPSQPVNALTALKKLISKADPGAQSTQSPSSPECNGTGPTIEEIFNSSEVPLLKLLVQLNTTMTDGGQKPFLKELEKEKETHVAEAKPNDPAFIFTTSGSTGFSKLVPVSHDLYLERGRSFAHLIGIVPEDIYFNDRSLGWLGGVPIIYLTQGVTRVLTDLSTPPKDPLALAWETIRSERCTCVMMVPLHIDMTMARPELWKDLNPRLRVLTTGGQPVRKQHVDVIGKLADSVVVCYGSTECGFVTFRHVCDNDEDSFQDGDDGVPLHGMEVKLMDENNQEVTEPGEAGEVHVRGKTVFTDYLGVHQEGSEEKQENVFTEDGWFPTSDVAFRDPQGHIHVICRKSNAIIHGAFIVYPGWLESRLERCPGVQSVIIVPVPDPTLYQELCACVVPEPGVKVSANDVREFAKSLFVVSDNSEMSQVPRYYVFFDSFPTTSTGKTDRKAIANTALSRLGIHATNGQ